MKLFTLGPVQMYEQTLDIASRPIPYFRTQEFSRIMLKSEALIKKMAYAPSEAKMVILTASGTAAMEAAVMNCLTPQDYALIINGGTFGQRFVDICQVHGIPHRALNIPFGQTLTEEMLRSCNADNQYTALLVNIHETSTTQLYDIQMLSNYCKEKNLIFIVDAISSFLADQIDFEGAGVDILITSSQKALALAPGLSILLLSDRVYRERVAKNTVKSLYFDLKKYIEDSVRGQTPFTPAVNIIYQLYDMLTSIEDMGIDNKIQHTYAIAQDFRCKAAELGIKMPEFPMSNAATALIFSNENAMEIYNALKITYGIEVTPNGGDLKSKVLRVGHIGNHNTKDNDELITGLSQILS